MRVDEIYCAGSLARRIEPDADRVEPRVEQLDQVSLQLGDPVGAGEADVTGPRPQHLDDVLGLEQLDLESGFGQRRPIAALANVDVDARR